MEPANTFSPTLTQYLEAYRVLATRVLKDQSDQDGQIKLVFRMATRRRPTDAEMAALRPYYESQLAIFAADKKKAEDLVHAGIQPVDPSFDGPGWLRRLVCFLPLSTSMKLRDDLSTVLDISTDGFAVFLETTVALP